MKTPTLAAITQLVMDIKNSGIDDDFRAYDDDDQPGILVTVGCDGSGRWSYQTGDTSFTGGAYGFPYWGQSAIYRNSNCREVARDILDDLRNSGF